MKELMGLSFNDTAHLPKVVTNTDMSDCSACDCDCTCDCSDFGDCNCS